MYERAIAACPRIGIPMSAFLNPMFGAGLSILVCAVIGRVLFGPPGLFIGAIIGIAIDLVLRWLRPRLGDAKFEAQQEAIRKINETAPLPHWFAECSIMLPVLQVGYVAFAHAIYFMAPNAALAWMDITSSVYAAMANIFWGYDKFAVELPKHGFAHLVVLFQHTFAVYWLVTILFLVAVLLRFPGLVGRAARLKYDPHSHRVVLSKVIIYLFIISVLGLILIPFYIFPSFSISISRLSDRSLIIASLYSAPASLSLLAPFLLTCLILIFALLVPKSLALRPVRKSAS